MTEIDVDRDSMGVLFKKTEGIASDLEVEIGTFSAEADGGIASDKIAFIVRAILESSQATVDAALAVSAVGRAALDGQMGTEAEILDSLDNFADGELG